ncbi:MAG: MCE family protein, partial [Nitrospinae bacterium]|nr:MCE family protein [Nitrospinota bacterium]
MYRKNVEFGVGIFVLAGILALAYLSINLGGLDIFDDGTYEVSANFTTATGLRKGASVEMAGVRVGRVSGISLDGEDAKIMLRID